MDPQLFSAMRLTPDSALWSHAGSVVGNPKFDPRSKMLIPKAFFWSGTCVPILDPVPTDAVATPLYSTTLRLQRRRSLDHLLRS